MSRDPQVDLIFSHNLPRYIAIGVDPNDAQPLITRLANRWIVDASPVLMGIVSLFVVSGRRAKQYLALLGSA